MPKAMTFSLVACFGLLGIALIAPRAVASNCEDDTTESVSSSGEIIKMQSGHVYEVNAGDTVDSALWLAVEDVLVCELGGDTVQIINTDEDGEKIEAQRLK